MSPEGAVTFRSSSPNGALATARELIEFGFTDVSITDTDGQEYSPAQFERRHVDRHKR